MSISSDEDVTPREQRITISHDVGKALAKYFGVDIAAGSSPLSITVHCHYSNGSGRDFKLPVLDGWRFDELFERCKVKYVELLIAGEIK